MKRFYFVRHGQSVLNQQGLFGGHTNSPLTDEGRSQAKAAGKMARKLNIHAIISSPLSRALETAQIIAKEINFPLSNIQINDLFIERNFGSMEQQPWSPDLDLDGIADIETVDSILERARLAFEFLESQPEEHILVVSHGSFGRALRSIVQPDFVYLNRATGGSSKEGIPNAEIVCWTE